MQKTFSSKVLSLILTFSLCLGMLATIQTVSLTARAETIASGSGDQYEINFATDGNTATLNGITATVDFEVDLSGDGWGWNPHTNQEERGERISFAVHFSGNAEADGQMAVTISGTPQSGETFTDSFNIFVKEGKPIENNLDNTLFSHLSMNAMETYAGLDDLNIVLGFDPMDTYELYLSNLDKIESNGVYFNFWAMRSGGGYCVENEHIGLDLWAHGTPVRAGIYTIKVSSEKAGINATRTLDVNGKVGQDINENLMEGQDIEHETRFMMPACDVDDFVFTVSFAPSGGGESTSTSTSKDNSSSSSSSGNSDSGDSSSNTSTAPSPVIQSEAVSVAQKALTEAKNSGSATASVNMKNVSEISLNVIKAMAKAAGNMPIKLKADSMNGASVDVRLTIDPSKAVKGINLFATTTSISAKKVETVFKKYFDNDTSVISFTQQGDFGMPVEIAARVGNNLDTKTLVFYSYNKATNSYRQITDPKYWVDKNGYVHFTTTLAGDIIITDKSLRKK